MKIITLIEKAKSAFQDEGGDLIFDSDWIGYGREFIVDWAGRTKLFRRRSRLFPKQNPWLYQLPSNIIDLHLVLFDGDVLELTTYKDLEQRDSRFMSRVGLPSACYRDLSNQHELRLWPAPTQTDVDLIQFTDADEEDEDAGHLVDVNIAPDTHRFVTKNTAGGVVPVTVTTERGHIVDVVRTDAPQEQHVLRMFDGSSNLRGRIVQVIQSKLEVNMSYIPDLPELDDDFLEFEIPMPDHMDQAGLYYMLFRAYGKSIETGDDQKSAFNLQLYEAKVAEGIRRKSDSWQSRPRRVRGAY